MEGKLSNAAGGQNKRHSILATPLTKGVHAGQHVKIVTPEAAAANASDDTNEDLIMASPEQNDILSSPSSTSSLQECVASSTIKEGAPQEGDQANALLERKLRQNLNQIM